jgi:outer membrane protein, heavy metal efflux system
MPVADGRIGRSDVAERFFMRGVLSHRRRAVIAVVVVAVPICARAQAVQPVGGQPLTRLSMDEAVRLAVLRNQTLQAQRFTIDQAKADETTADLKPNINVSFGVAGFTPFTPSSINSDFFANVASYSAGMSMLFERGGKRGNRLGFAQATTDVTTKTVSDNERQLRFQTAQAFIGVLLAKSTLDLAQQNLKNFSDVVDVNRQRVTAGDLAEADFFKISLQKLQFEQDLSAAEVAIVQARANLRQLVGFDTVAEEFDAVGELAYTSHPLDLEDLKRQALDARPDLQAAQSSVVAAQRSLTLEKSNRARDITGELDYSHTGPQNAFGVLGSFDLPIRDRNQGNIAKAEVTVRQATESQLAARYLVLTDVVNAYAGWQTAEKVVKLYESGYLDQAKQSLDISQYVFQRGAGSLLDLLDAERTYRDTQLGYRQALSNYMTSVAQLNQAVGKQVMP